MAKKNVIRQLAIGYIISGISFSLFNSVYILLMTDLKGFNDSQTSIIVGLTALFVLPTSLLWGVMIDRNKKLILFAKISLISSSVFTILLLFANNFYLFFLVYILRTIAVQPYFSILSEYCIDKTSEANIRFGAIIAFLSFGWGLAGIIGMFLMDYLGIYGLMFLSIALAVFQLINLNMMPEYVIKEVNEDSEKNKVGLASNLKILFKNKIFMPFLLLYSLLIATSGSATGYGVPSLLIRLNTPQNIILFIPFVLVVFEIYAISNVEKFSFFRKTYKALFIAAIILLIRWLILISTSSYMILMASLLLHGFSQGVLGPLVSANVVKMVEERQRSTAFLLSTLLQTLFIAGINLVLGQLVAYVGNIIYGLVYLIIVITCIIFIIRKLKAEKVNI